MAESGAAAGAGFSDRDRGSIRRRDRNRPGHAENPAPSGCRVRHCAGTTIPAPPRAPHNGATGLPRGARCGLFFRLRGRPPARHRRGRSPFNQPTRDHADGATLGRRDAKASQRPRRPAMRAWSRGRGSNQDRGRIRICGRWNQPASVHHHRRRDAGATNIAAPFVAPTSRGTGILPALHSPTGRESVATKSDTRRSNASPILNCDGLASFAIFAVKLRCCDGATLSRSVGDEREVLPAQPLLVEHRQPSRTSAGTSSSLVRSHNRVDQGLLTEVIGPAHRHRRSRPCRAHRSRRRRRWGCCPRARPRHGDPRPETRP